MSIVEKPDISPPAGSEPLDPEDFPWFENGEHMDQETFHERYLKTPAGYRAELVEGVVYVMASPMSKIHGRGTNRARGWLFNYSSATPGTEAQDDATTILGPKSEPQPDCSLLILPEYGGQTREGGGAYTFGAPELIVEVAYSSRSIDLHAKLRDYERAGAREYIVYDLGRKGVHWFELRDGRFEPMAPDPDGLFRSRIFPGLWLDPVALVSGDKPALLAALNRGLADPGHAAFVAELERRRAERAARP